MESVTFICFYWVACICLLSAVAAPSNYGSFSKHPLNTVRLLKSQNENDGTGNYRYAFEQSDGTGVDQSGEIKNQESGHESLAVTGVFRWISPEGIYFVVHYTADEEGYQPVIEQEPAISSLSSTQLSQHHIATLIG